MPDPQQTVTGGWVFATTQQQTRRRGDPRHVRFSSDMRHVYGNPQYPLRRLGTLLSEPISYGTSKRLSEEPLRYPVLRMNNLTAEGLDLTDLKYLELDPLFAGPLKVRIGDLLVNRTNSDELVGKMAVFDQPGNWLYASYLLRLRLDKKQALPEFIASFMNSPAGRVQMTRASRRAIGMANVNTTEIGAMLIPLPDTKTQQKLLTPLIKARTERAAERAKAAAALSGINDEMATMLNIPFTGGPPALVYAVTTRTTLVADRLGAQFFHPERAAVLAAIRDADVPHRPLSQAADIIRDVVAPAPGETYMGLSAVTSHTGELVPVGDEAASALRYQPGDVLMCRLRPYLNKVYLADHTALCSTEFYVLRAKPGVLPAYLAVLLRSKLTTAQTMHMMTGNTHPRVSPDDAKNISVPIPSMTDQRAIAADYAKRLKLANTDRAKTEKAWVAAQLAFDKALLG